MLELSADKKTKLYEAGAAAFFFFAAAAIVLWQNSRVGALWDLSYVLENAYRMSLGDVPYKDFPFPYAPLTFLVQAAIIKLTGAAFRHHVFYCAVTGGVASVLTWRVVFRLLESAFPRWRAAAFLLAAPSAVLGIYCVFPHPFYDADCTLVVLICILLLLRAERKNFPRTQSFLTGALIAAPIFVKQNTGLAFFASSVTALVVLVGVNIWRKNSAARGQTALIGGALFGFGAALLLVHEWAGLENYYRWTVVFAAERRTPALADMLSVYQGWNLLLWLALFAAGAVLLRLNRAGKKFLTVMSACLMCAPFVWSTVYLALDADSSERAERLAATWAFVLVVSFVFAVLSLRRGRGDIRRALPFVLIATVHGAFLSQQLWGSTYALWSLLIILIAGILTSAREYLDDEHSATLALSASAVVALTLLVSGGFYVYSNERLDYINSDEGELSQSVQPRLAGLNVRGSYLPDFDELMDYAGREIPPDDAVLMLPGEDLFYYASGRRPQFPVLMFDHTVNPLASEDIVREARERDVRWLIIKNDLQIDGEPLEDKERLLELLKQDFRRVDELNNYEIYKRRAPGDPEDEQDNGDDSGDDSGDDAN